MPVQLIVPFSNFYSAVSGSKKLRKDRRNEISYRIAVGRFAFLYRDKTFVRQRDGPQDQWWQSQISVLDPIEPENALWNSVRNIRRDHVAELKKNGSSSTAFAAAIHHMLHATPTRRAQRSAKVLDQLAFGEPAEEILGQLCEFTEEKPEDEVEALRRQKLERTLVDISDLKWTQMPKDGVDFELSMDLGLEVFEEEIGGRYYMYGATRITFSIDPMNFEIKKLYKTSRGETPEYVRYDKGYNYYVEGPTDNFNLLKGNAFSDAICIVSPISDGPAKLQIEAQVHRFHLDVKSINTATNRQDDLSDDERVNLINKMVCVLLNKRSTDGTEREIRLCKAEIDK